MILLLSLDTDTEMVGFQLVVFCVVSRLDNQKKYYLRNFPWPVVDMRIFF